MKESRPESNTGCSFPRSNNDSNLRTDPATNNVTDYGVGKALENLPELKGKLSAIIDRYHDVQQDILESFVDRGQLQTLIQPTILPNGKPIPGLKLDHPRQLALMHALVRFSHIAAQDSFSTPEVHADTAEALGRTTTEYTLGSLRYDLSKLRAKGLVQRLHKSRRYRLTADGYRICVVFLKLFEKLYAPLTSAIPSLSIMIAAWPIQKPANSTNSTGLSSPRSINSSMLSVSKSPEVNNAHYEYRILVRTRITD